MRSAGQAVLFIVAAFVLLLLVSPTSEAAITCSDVIKNIRPCAQYLQSGSGLPPPACCAGASALASAAKTTADKQTACGCLKSASKSMKINAQLAKDLPGNCRISLPYPISPTVDCTTIR